MNPIADIHVERHYRLELARPILDDVRWRIEPSEHWALVGPNGCGKSTLLSILSGDLWPSVGTIRVLGQEYGRVDKRELRKRIGLVNSALFGALPTEDTGEEIAASGLMAMIGKLGALPPDALDRGRAALAKVSALSTTKKPYGVLSQGERQRVMIARALVNDPALLILDEACSGLDPVARERFLDDLGKLAASPGGPTQIHVTHHLEEIPGFITHALVLREGRVLAMGDAAQVLTSETLSTAFDAPCTVETESSGATRRYRLRVTVPSAKTGEKAR
ncbi:MAG TPA: ATP-binding cassette domain-containing protein [Polyangiaceae bacterium]|jgi:iron complex transport system ATP-binding protein|nr:ATP-binding cassette domain-containing protein [Polyangiaceae bacterium]